MQAQSLSFSLIDSTGGYEVSPGRVRLAALAEFSGDVAALLKGSSKDVDVSALDVAVRPGSLTIQTADIAAAGTLFHDLAALNASELLDALDAKRREVIERWQRAARQKLGLAYRVRAAFLDRPVVIDQNTDYRADDADQWVMVERYVRGVIEDLGGATKPNAHVRLPDNQLLKVYTERSVLHDDKLNRLYKQAVLRIRAQYNVATRELKDARLIEFVEYAPSYDDDEMSRLARRGAQAWKGVDDATAWVDELRGGDAD